MNGPAVNAVVEPPMQCHARVFLDSGGRNLWEAAVDAFCCCNVGRNSREKSVAAGIKYGASRA